MCRDVYCCPSSLQARHDNQVGFVNFFKCVPSKDTCLPCARNHTSSPQGAQRYHPHPGQHRLLSQASAELLPFLLLSLPAAHRAASDSHMAPSPVNIADALCHLEVNGRGANQGIKLKPGLPAGQSYWELAHSFPSLLACSIMAEPWQALACCLNGFCQTVTLAFRHLFAFS